MRKSYTTHYAFKPRIIVPEHPWQDLSKFSFVPIKGNQILLFAKYTKFREPFRTDFFLHLSIHEIRSDSRVGLALWSFNSSVDTDDWNSFDLELIKSTENPLAITFWARLDDWHWKLFDISTTEADASDNFPLIESGRMNFDLKIRELAWVPYKSLGLSENSCSVEPALMRSPSQAIP